MSDYRYSVSLRVTHPTIDPDKITESLDIVPFRKWKVGENRATPIGRPLEGKNKESYWAVHMHTEKKLLSTDMHMEDYLVHLNNKLEKHKDYFRELITTGGCIEYFIGWFSADNVGLTLSTELMEQTSELGIEIGLCAYVG